MAWLDRIETDIKSVWYQWSTKVLAFLTVFPEGYNLLAGMGWYQNVPQNFAHFMSSVAAVGLLAKVYKQKSKDAAP